MFPTPVFLLIMALFIAEIRTQDLLCCSHATGSCRSACEKILLVQMAADARLRNATISEVAKSCSPQLNSFWECLNATFKDMSRGDSWPGRLCCPLPQSESCQRACVTATTDFDLAQGCRQSDEIAFFRCLERQKEGNACCSNTTNSVCKSACFDIFKSKQTPNKGQRQLVQDNCEKSDPHVLGCVKEFVTLTPAKNLHKHIPCCSVSPNAMCSASCKILLANSSITIQEIFDGLETHGCGPPLPQEYFWQCFLQPIEPLQSPSTSLETSQIDRVGMDSAKWHCCQHATTDQCQRLCMRTYTKDWHRLWPDFNTKCLSRISEEKLKNCIDDVEEPCELGCEGLSFCTNFNNRPTELFRSCTPGADEAARSSVADWRYHAHIRLDGLSLPLNTSLCSPELWKATACTLHIRPCSRPAHANQICRSACVDIVTKCVDWTRAPTEHSADSICSAIAPNEECVQLDEYLTPAAQVKAHVTSPCKGMRCEAHETCQVNRNGRNRGFECIAGCKLGEVSEYKVPEGTLVRIPTPLNPTQKGCLKICKCLGGRIEECQPLPCIKLTPCSLGGQYHQHGAIFNVDCNQCTCFAGEIICSKKQCEVSDLSGRNTAYTTLPCNCSPHYVPVCGRDGKTYPSACLAKCAELSDGDIEHGACEDPCQGNKCPRGQKCIPNPQVCLSLMNNSCKQFICVNGTANCRNSPFAPVCDVKGAQHDNPCFLAHQNIKLSYHGECLENCRSSGQFCGINGRTYQSECAAFADFVAIDYAGPCMAFGLITDQKSKQCGHIQCPKLPDANCYGVTPPGACCPLCGGAMRLLYSRKQIDRALYALQEKGMDGALTLKSLLMSLQRLVQIEQCVLRGYMTVEMDIFVVVQTGVKYPNGLQLEACVREAEKITNLINTASPRIVTELSLSSLTLANIVHTQTSLGVDLTANLALILFCLLVLLK